MEERIGLRSCGRNSQPDDKEHGEGAHDHTRYPVDDGQDGRELWPVDLDVGREGADPLRV